MRAIEDAGYRDPTPIQARAIPMVLQGRDVLGLAQTGTGKTASFTLPMIEMLSHGVAKARMPRSLILEPTRELAAQLADQFRIYGKNHRLKVALLIGGVSFEEQNRIVEKGADVLVATPGRLLDHLERGRVLLNGVRILIIDEADRMLDMGFIPDIERIVQRIPSSRQTLLFSATMPRAIESLADRFMRDPVRIEVSPRASAAGTVSQHLIWVKEDLKIRVLESLLRSEPIRTALVFCNRKRDVSLLERRLAKSRFSVGALHGDMDQHSRMRTLDSFREGGIQVLVASNVAARGLDMMAVSHVVIYDVPPHSEDYVHRIGRTGRAGEEGFSFMLACYEDVDHVRSIEGLIRAAIPLHEKSMKPPSPGSEAWMFRKKESDSSRKKGGRRRSSRRGSDRRRAGVSGGG